MGSLGILGPKPLRFGGSEFRAARKQTRSLLNLNSKSVSPLAEDQRGVDVGPKAHMRTCPKAQNVPTALYNMVFGPEILNIWVVVKIMVPFGSFF